VCSRLSEGRETARRVAVFALGANPDEAAVACVRDVLQNGSGAGRAAAAQAFRQHVARGWVPVDTGWTVVQDMLRSPDAPARREGLGLAPLFTAAFARPAVQALLQDPDPGVAAAAKATLAQVDGIDRTDILHGDVDP
jgi:hypothetical protein